MHAIELRLSDCSNKTVCLPVDGLDVALPYEPHDFVVEHRRLGQQSLMLLAEWFHRWRPGLRVDRGDGVAWVVKEEHVGVAGRLLVGVWVHGLGLTEDWVARIVEHAHVGVARLLELHPRVAVALCCSREGLVGDCELRRERTTRRARSSLLTSARLHDQR